MSKREGDQDRWLEISVELTAEFAEPVTHLFSRYGDGRVFVAQTGEWDADDTGSDSSANGAVTVFCYLKFDDTTDNRKGMIDIGLRLMDEVTVLHSRRERIVNPEEWENQTFPTIRVGRRIVISPWSIENGPPASLQPEDVEVFLSPGLAFGTGNHPTTQLCLNQIEDEFELGRLAGSQVLDVGCGSGVLAIAALKMGAARAWCLDIDETAVRAVADNLVMSGVSERANVLEGSVPNVNLPDIRFDYVFANITSRVLIDIADTLIENAFSGGTILASGILVDQVSAVEKAFVKNDAAKIVETRRESDWIMMRIVKSAA
ncbi:MAG: methyltransferase domain-containing protein [Chloroflexi bacterium]|nr:methyltransferase domain-containing protein [Chloroflexota bacterium]